MVNLTGERMFYERMFYESLFYEKLIYESLREGVLALLFLRAAWSDLRFRKIPNRLLCNAAALRLFFCLPEIYLAGWQEAAFYFLRDFCGSVLLMIFLLTVIRMCGKKLGMGDVKLAGTAALFAGLYRMLWVLLLGTGLAAAVLCLRMIGRKGSRRDTVPLAPFLLGGFLLEFLLRFSLPGLF